MARKHGNPAAKWAEGQPTEKGYYWGNWAGDTCPSWFDGEQWFPSHVETDEADRIDIPDKYWTNPIVAPMAAPK